MCGFKLSPCLKQPAAFTFEATVCVHGGSERRVLSMCFHLYNWETKCHHIAHYFTMNTYIVVMFWQHLQAWKIPTVTTAWGSLQPQHRDAERGFCSAQADENVFLLCTFGLQPGFALYFYFYCNPWCLCHIISPSKTDQGSLESSLVIWKQVCGVCSVWRDVRLNVPKNEKLLC